MSRDCSTCKYEETDPFETPCYYCVDKKFYEPKTERDCRAIHFELLGMYITELDLAMGNDYNECDNIMCDVKKDKFMDLLSEYYTAIKIELEKGE